MIDEMLDEIESFVEGTKEKHYGLAVGTVINPLDPMMLGRVQVQLPFIDSLDLQPWARVAVPMAGFMHGTYFIPDLGTEVLVAFEHGDVSCPYIIGCLWNVMQLPPMPSPVPQIRAIRTLTGNQIVFTEVPPSVTIQTGPTPPVAMPAPPSPVGPYQTIMLSPAGIQVMSPTTITLQVGTSSIMITPAGIVLQAGGSMLAITPADIGALATALNLIGSGSVLVQGAMVNINPS